MKQEMRKNIGKLGSVFIISSIIITLFVLWGALFPASLNQTANSALTWMIDKFGWFYMLITALLIFFAVGLAISPYGKIKLGKRNDEPEYSWVSWVGMLFAAGIGVGFVFWGVAEPLLYYLDPPVGYQPKTTDSAIAGLRYGAYHWSLHPWSIYAVIGMTLAYVQYRKRLPALISSAFYPILGERVNGWPGKTIDILAVIATCTGVATTFGLSAMQITGGLSHISPIPNSPWTQLIIIVIVTILFLFSAARGVDRGIKLLSNTNLIIAALLLLFVIVFGPTLFIIESFITPLGGYMTNVIPMSLTLTPFSESEWLGTNTIFFWAWHISWAPFMGLFIAKISRGRTIREFIAAVLIVPTLIAILWFTTFGGTGLYIELFGAGGLSDLVNSQVELALFSVLGELPFSFIMNIVAIILIGIFFVTSADSAALVLGSMTSNGDPEPKLFVKLVWGLLIAGAASVLLFSGGGGLRALQTASIVAALPFAIIIIFMVVSIMMILSKDKKLDQRMEKKRDLHELKNEFRDEITHGVYQEVKTEFSKELIEDVKDDVYEEVKNDFYDDVKDDVYQEVKNEFYEDVKDDILDEVKEELYDEVKDEIYDDVKDDFYEEIKEKVQDEVKKEIIEEINDER